MNVKIHIKTCLKKSNYVKNLLSFFQILIICNWIYSALLFKLHKSITRCILVKLTVYEWWMLLIGIILWLEMNITFILCFLGSAPQLTFFIKALEVPYVELFE